MTRTLAITQNVTLDGRIEMLANWFDPAVQGENDDQLAALKEQDRDSDATLLGRQTFEDFRGYWPLQSDDTTGITDYLNQVQKYVVSTTMTEPEWQNSTVLGSVDDVRRLKEAAGQDIVCTGSITLTHALVEAGLVDEYRLFTYPFVQGRGRGLFPDGNELADLRLLETQTFRNGVTLTRYAAG